MGSETPESSISRDISRYRRIREPSAPVEGLLQIARETCARLAELYKDAKKYPVSSGESESSPTHAELHEVLQRFLDVLQDLNDHPNLPPYTHKPITHSLITLAEEFGNYPTSLNLPDDVKYENSELYVSTSHSDIHRASGAHGCVAIKVPRRYANYNPSAFRKVGYLLIYSSLFCLLRTTEIPYRHLLVKPLYGHNFNILMSYLSLALSCLVHTIYSLQ
jgi:hypothetical protein